MSLVSCLCLPEIRIRPFPYFLSSFSFCRSAKRCDNAELACNALVTVGEPIVAGLGGFRVITRLKGELCCPVRMDVIRIRKWEDKRVSVFSVLQHVVSQPIDDLPIEILNLSICLRMAFSCCCWLYSKFCVYTCEKLGRQVRSGVCLDFRWYAKVAG